MSRALAFFAAIVVVGGVYAVACALDALRGSGTERWRPRRRDWTAELANVLADPAATERWYADPKAPREDEARKRKT